MAKDKNLEMKIYELLGIKVFRKMAFMLRNGITYTLYLPSLLGKSFTEKKNKLKYRLLHDSNNYTIGDIKNLEDIKKFKNKLLLNASIHLFSLSLCLYTFYEISQLQDAIPIGVLTTTSIVTAVNMYCLMLQRYNQLRINKVLKKMEPRIAKQKDELIQEIKEYDRSLPEEHTYEITGKKGESTKHTIEDLTTNSTVEQLKQYREYLIDYSFCLGRNRRYGIDSYPSMGIKLPKKKELTIKVNNK